ncbi:hypothetical protein F6R98_10540 [Candidatus Methylospira mobilis]|uniref:Uncharacterized protein n=1 Tax=Candidatus Methylospira mobilis TaxID=1808979 RepID=A0A5Q0BHH0_9GAMM|nr:hypothetical protein [Candidatus Methylospira mobilis]QFY42999.1 hypothetical protein F6R98_10540 [Candidatus Methylospira mobilis]
MSRIIEIGAPVSGEKSANDALKEAFEGAGYPLDVTIESHLQRAIALPEIGVYLPASKRTFATIRNEDAFHRAVSSIEQIAALNGYQKIVTIEEGHADPAADGAAGADATETKSRAKKPANSGADASTHNASDPNSKQGA